MFVGQEKQSPQLQTPFAVLVLVFLNGNRLASFLFLTNRSGKTELSKALSEFLFPMKMLLSVSIWRNTWNNIPGENSLVPPDILVMMMEDNSPNRFVENPIPWFCLMKRRKSTSRYFHLLLQVFDDGRLTDFQREERSILKYRSYFDEQSWCGYSSVFFWEMGRSCSRPKFLSERDNAVFSFFEPFSAQSFNRIDETIILIQVSSRRNASILDIQLQRIQQRLFEKNIVLVVNDSAKTS